MIHIFSFEEDTPSLNKDTSIVKVSSRDFDISKLKKKIGKHLENRQDEVYVGTRYCQNLRCKCIATTADIEYSLDPSNPHNQHNINSGDEKLQQDEQEQLRNDASNICLKLLSFLMLDGDENRNNNLDLLFQQSMSFLDKQRGPDEIMVEVFFPIYITVFQPVYLKLKNESNYSDSFTYDQRLAGGNMYYDENEYTCDNDAKCKVALTDLVTTWKNVLNVMNFDWKMGIGSMVSNFNYLMMMCNEDRYWLQTNEKMWAPNTARFLAPCNLNQEGKSFNNFIKSITDAIFNMPFHGIYLNDLVGYLGYSSTFDLLSLKGDKYMYNARNLHPIQGMDVFRNKDVLIEEGWEQCNYLGTYRNWVKQATNLKNSKVMGKGQNHL